MIDYAKIWRIDCFFADKKYREQYLTTIRELITEQIRTQQHIARHSRQVTYDVVGNYLAKCSKLLVIPWPVFKMCGVSGGPVLRTSMVTVFVDT